MKADTVGFTPECTTLKTVETLRAFLVAISTLHFRSVALFDGQHIKQTVDAKVCGQVIQSSTIWYSTLSSAFWACYDIMAATRSLNPVQAVKTKIV